MTNILSCTQVGSECASESAMSLHSGHGESWRPHQDLELQKWASELPPAALTDSGRTDSFGSKSFHRRQS